MSLSPRFKTNLTATAANHVAEGPVSPSARLTQFAGVSFWIFDVSTFCTSNTGTLASAAFQVVVAPRPLAAVEPCEAHTQGAPLDRYS